MSRISANLATRGSRKLLIPFLTVGFPTIKEAEQLAYCAINSGADILELGMPFSDPLADGPDIQYSSHLALENGVTLHHALELAERIRRRSDIPLVLMGYINPLIAYGLQHFIADAATSGVDGFIIPDLPVDESSDFLRILKRYNLSSIFLAAPTSTPSRIKLIDRHSTDFVYAVTVTGVTGATGVFDNSTDAYMAKIRKQLTKPFVAGFGVSTPESAIRLCRHADGVVVGSAIIREIGPNPKANHRNLERVERFLVGIRQAIDGGAKTQD